MEGQGGWLNLLVERSCSALSEFFSASVLITTPEKPKEPSSSKEEPEMFYPCKKEEQAKDGKNSCTDTPEMFYPCKGESSCDFPDDELSGEISVDCSRFFILNSNNFYVNKVPKGKSRKP